MGSYSIRDVGMVNQLDRMEKEMTFMKTRQFIGKKTLATKVNRAGTKTLSNDAWYNEMIGPPQLQALQQEVTFIAESQTDPYGILTVEFTDLQGNIIQNYGTNAGTSVGGGPSIDYIYQIATTPGDGTLKWEIGTVSSPENKWYARYIVSATDKGTVGFSADLIFYS